MKAQYKIYKLKDPCKRPNQGPTSHGKLVIKRAHEGPDLPTQGKRIQIGLTADEATTIMRVQEQVDAIAANNDGHQSDSESISSGELWRPPDSPYSPVDSE